MTHNDSILLLKGNGCLGFSHDSRQSKRFEVGFEVMRQLEEMRKLSAGFPGEPVCERHDWTQHPRGRQRPFCSGGLSFWPAHQMYRTEAPIMALWHMGSGEHPALMMDLANCSRVQVSGTWYLLPKKTNTPQLLPPPFLMAVVCQCMRISAGVKERGGSIIHLQPGWDAGSGCLPAFSPSLSSWERGVGDASGCLCPGSEFPKGANCSSRPQKCTWPDPGTDVPPWCHVVSSGTSLPFWCLSDCRCWQQSRLAAQDKSDSNHTSSQLTLIQGNRTHTLSLNWQAKQLT